MKLAAPILFFLLLSSCAIYATEARLSVKKQVRNARKGLKSSSLFADYVS